MLEILQPEQINSKANLFKPEPISYFQSYFCIYSLHALLLPFFLQLEADSNNNIKTAGEYRVGGRLR